MLEKLLLAAVATFSLNLFLGVCIQSPPQTTSELNPPPIPAQPARFLQNNYALNLSPTNYRSEH